MIKHKTYQKFKHLLVGAIWSWGGHAEDTKTTIVYIVIEVGKKYVGKENAHGEGNGGAPEMRGVAPAAYVAVTGMVEGVAMPEVMLLKGGMVVPTGVVGTGEFDVKEVEEDPAGVAAAEDEVEAAPTFCFFTRRAC